MALWLISVPEPAPQPTQRLIGLEGKVSARVSPVKKIIEVINNNMTKNDLCIQDSFLSGLCWFTLLKRSILSSEFQGVFPCPNRGDPLRGIIRPALTQTEWIPTTFLNLLILKTHVALCVRDFSENFFIKLGLGKGVFVIDFFKWCVNINRQF